MPPTRPARRFMPHLLILSAVCASYFNALSNGFVYDDVKLVETNPLVKGWQYLPDIFTTGYWTAANGSSEGLYRPLAIASFLVDHALGGGGPFMYHLSNVVLHLLCSLLVFAVLRAILGRETPALLSALVFAVHPVHTEAVAWVSGRAELLCAALTLLSFRIYLARPRRLVYVLASAAVFFVALLAKETAVVLPLIIVFYTLLYDRPSGPGDGFRRLAVGLWPFAVSLTLYMAVRTVVLNDAMTPPPESIPLFEVGPSERFLTMCTAFFHYIRLAFIPTDLSVFYYFFTRSLASPSALLFLAGMALLAYFSRRLAVRHKDVFFGTSWFFIALLPVSNILPVGIIMSERAMYLPSVGPCLLLGLLFSRAVSDARTGPATIRAAGYLLFGLTLAAFAVMSLLRNPYWKDQAAFQKEQLAAAERYVRVNPAVAINYTRLANLRLYHGMYDEGTARILDEGLRIDPDEPGLHLVRGMLYEHHGRDEDALREYDKSLSAAEYDETYTWAAGVHLRHGRLDEAERMLDGAIRLNPYQGSSYFNKGIIQYQRGDADTAYGLFERSVSLDPSIAKAFFCMGVIRAEKGDTAGALALLDQALALDPADASASDLRNRLAGGR